MTSLLLACFLCGPLYPQAAGAPGQTVDSLAERACEARALPLPKVRLVKDVLTAMPDKCDERLFGTWYCDLSCLYDDCRPRGGTHTLRRSIDPDGYERIHSRREIEGDTFLAEWKVERKWGAPASNIPVEKGKLVAASCNGKTDAGDSTLSVNRKNPDGSGRKLIKYWVDGANQKLSIEYYDVRWEGDAAHKKLLDKTDCWRELAP